MPTYVVFRNLKELECIRGINTQSIESIFTKYYWDAWSFSGEDHSMLELSFTESSLITIEFDGNCLE